MTPIGHFMCQAAVAGNVDLTTERETYACFAYYVFFLAAFSALSFFLAPGTWAMHLHDWFGNAALIFFIFFWGRKDARRQAFVCVLIGGQVLSAYTHMFDTIALTLWGSVPEGMWRPHNILHTPLAALVIPLLAAPLVNVLMKGPGMLKAYFFLSLGYFLHIFCDTVTYDFAVYPFWPISSASASLVSVFQRPDCVSAFLGHPLSIFERATARNIDGFIVYRAEVAVNLLLMVLFAVKSAVKRIVPSGALEGA